MARNRTSGNPAWWRSIRERPPRSWRCPAETRIIQQLVWQWAISPDPRKWSARKAARFLGVTHAWVQYLVRRFQRRPEIIRSIITAFGTANFQQLERARQESRRLRSCGELRHLNMRFRRIRYDDHGKKRRVVLMTQTEIRRRSCLDLGRPLGPPLEPLLVHLNDLPDWARGWPWLRPGPTGGILPPPPAPAPSPVFRPSFRHWHSRRWR